METTKEQEGGLLHQILPPRLEDAGLEDCALPPDSIKEAFFKAATAVKSRAAFFFTSDEDEEAQGNCVSDPWPVSKVLSDKVVGVCPGPEAPGPCGAKKRPGGAVDVGGDEMVLRGDEEKEDKLVIGGEELGEGRKACVEGLQGLEIEEKKLRNVGGSGSGGDEEEEDDEKPTLVEGVV